MTLVSIIIPAFKAEKYIVEALECVEAQYYSHWELLVIEDGFNDGTEDIVKVFSSRLTNHRIEYIKHSDNLGLGATRNTGIDASKGQFIAFLDHDDKWKPNHLTDAISVLEGEDEASIAFSTAQMFEDRTNQYRGLWGPTDEEMTTFEISLYQRSFITPSAVVLHRSVIDQVGLFDTNPQIHYSEDYDYWIRAARLKIKFIHLSSITCLYRKMHSSAATSHPEMMLERQLYVLNKHADWVIVPHKIKQSMACDYWLYLAIHKLKLDPKLAFSLFWNSVKHEPFNFRRLSYFCKAIIRLLIHK